MIQPTISRTHQPPAWAAAELRLRKAMADWIARSMARQRRVSWQGGHDEGSFVASWFGYYLLTGDSQVLDFLRWLGGGWLAWAGDSLVHGYYPAGEVHHQPENFIFFLPRLWQVDPNPAVAQALDDAAHHAGNWVEGIPPWYDWERHRFRSWRLGTREVADRPPDDLERPDHFRIIQMALCAYRAGGDERYLALARDFCIRWAHDILSAELLPAVSRPASQGATGSGSDTAGQAAAGSLDERVELHIAAGTTDVLLDVFALSGEPDLARAAKKVLVDGLAHVGEPNGHPLCAALRRYRISTGDTSRDEEIRARIECEESDVEAGMLTGPPRGAHPAGLGRRFDQVQWVVKAGDDWRRDERPSPPALALAWDVTGDEWLAAEAMTMAAQRIELAASALRDGREHGCGGRTVSAVASGHGRNAGIGEATGVLYPLALGAARQFAVDQPQITVTHEGKPGLPEKCATLWRHGPPPSLGVYNGGDKPCAVAIRIQPLDGRNPEAEQELSLAPGCLCQLSI
jgi:hypothetical protein